MVVEPEIEPLTMRDPDTIIKSAVALPSVTESTDAFSSSMNIRLPPTIKLMPSTPGGSAPPS